MATYGVSPQTQLNLLVDELWQVKRTLETLAGDPDCTSLAYQALTRAAIAIRTARWLVEDAEACFPEQPAPTTERST